MCSLYGNPKLKQVKICRWWEKKTQSTVCCGTLCRVACDVEFCWVMASRRGISRSLSQSAEQFICARKRSQHIPRTMWRKRSRKSADLLSSAWWSNTGLSVGFMNSIPECGDDIIVILLLTSQSRWLPALICSDLFVDGWRRRQQKFGSCVWREKWNLSCRNGKLSNQAAKQAAFKFVLQDDWKIYISNCSLTTSTWSIKSASSTQNEFLC